MPTIVEFIAGFVPVALILGYAILRLEKWVDGPQ